MLAIAIFTIFAVVVVFGVVDLKKSKLSYQQKIMILSAVGILLSVSLLISALKQTRHLTFSLLKTSLNDLQRKFTQLPTYKYKYDLLVSEPFNEVFYSTNYPEYNNIVFNRRQKVIFVSRKDQGASTFLFHLTKKLQQKRIPTFYIKIQTQIYDEIDFLEIVNVPSFETFQDVINTWNYKGTIPYIIIDGLQYLVNCPQIISHLAKFFQKLNINFIGNTQNKKVLQRLFSIIPYSSFIIKQWIAPDYSLLQKVVPNRYFRKLPQNFHTIYQIQTSSQQQILMRSSSNNKDLISNLGIGDVLRQISSKPIPLSTLKNMISAEQINKGIASGLLKISNGLVSNNMNYIK